MRWHLPAGYRENIPPAYYPDKPDVRGGVEVIWQPDVYPLAESIAASRGLTGLIDVGCGRGTRCANSVLPRRVGIDYGQNLAYCRKTWGDAATWLEVNLEDMAGIEAVRTAGCVVVCSDVIEHLIDPTALLRWFGTFPEPVVISTPDRKLSNSTRNNGPRNGAHVREWELHELVAVMEDFGLAVTAAEHTRSNTAVDAKRTILIVLR